MITTGFRSRNAILRMFGIHNGHLKGTSILFASYETDGDTSGEAIIFLREVKTCKLLRVRGVHTNVNSVNPKKGLRGLFKGQWSPDQFDPHIAMRMEPFNSNPRFIRIMTSLLKQQAIVAKFQKHYEEQKEMPSFVKIVMSFIKRIRLFPSRKSQ